MRHNFDDSMTDSHGNIEQCVMNTLAKVYSAKRVVRVTDKALDKKGVDFIVHLHGGDQVRVDLKWRRAGESKWWADPSDPELGIETCSVGEPDEDCEDCACKCKQWGWTLSTAKITDVVAFVPEDVGRIYLIDSRMLRLVAQHNYQDWIERFGLKTQKSQGYHELYVSQSVFVPMSHLAECINVIDVELVCDADAPKPEISIFGRIAARLGFGGDHNASADVAARYRGDVEKYGL